MPSNASQLDEVMCGPYNRRGLLCGECKDGYGPAYYSFDLKCANCSSLKSGITISLYILLQFVPSTLIFICLVVCRFNITLGPLLGYVLFCQISQIVVTYKHHFIYDYIQSLNSETLRILIRLSVAASQFWSLKFFGAVIPPFCLNEKLTGIQVHMLDFVPPIYLFVLVLTSCILIQLHARNNAIVQMVLKPIRIILRKANITTVTGDAVFHAFASFIFLSNVSVIFAMYRFVQATPVYNSTGAIQKHVLYIDPTVEQFSQKSVPYILVAAVLSIFLSVIPSFLLCIYPTRLYRYLSKFLSARKQLAITAFAEALHSCFKDGLNGTRDYRALAGATLVGVVMHSGIEKLYVSATGYGFSHIVATASIMFVVVLVAYVKPCKSAIANISLCCHMSLLGIVVMFLYLWEYDVTTVGTSTLKTTFIATFFTPHIFVALWSGYALTNYTLLRFGIQLHGLKGVANCVTLCLRRRRYQEYEEMCAQ